MSCWSWENLEVYRDVVVSICRLLWIIFIEAFASNTRHNVSPLFVFLNYNSDFSFAGLKNYIRKFQIRPTTLLPKRECIFLGTHSLEIFPLFNCSIILLLRKLSLKLFCFLLNTSTPNYSALFFIIDNKQINPTRLINSNRFWFVTSNTLLRKMMAIKKTGSLINTYKYILTPMTDRLSLIRQCKF